MNQAEIQALTQMVYMMTPYAINPQALPPPQAMAFQSMSQQPQTMIPPIVQQQVMAPPMQPPPPIASIQQQAAMAPQRPNMPSIFNPSLAQPSYRPPMKPSDVELPKIESKTQAPGQGFGDKFVKKEGEWDCTACYVRNPEENNECVSCGTGKDVKEKTTSAPAFKPTVFTSTASPKFLFGGGASTNNSSGGLSFASLASGKSLLDNKTTNAADNSSGAQKSNVSFFFSRQIILFIFRLLHLAIK